MRALVLALMVVFAGVLPAEAQVSLSNSRRIDFVSGVNGHSYSIKIALPEAAPPAGGYPVLYVLDGDAYFASAAEAVRANGNAPQMLVVGVGYPDTPAFVAESAARRAPPPAAFSGSAFRTAVGLERMYDMTLPMTAEALAAQNIKGLIEPRVSDVGGLDDYLRIIETEVKPRVAGLAKVDASNQAIFGHSLGGLAVLRALFTEPEAFRTFLIASPSIWWNGRAVLADEKAFPAPPRVMVTVGSEEQDSSKVSRAVAALIGTPQEVEASTQRSRMVDNACDLARRLKVECVVFPQTSHGLSPWPALARGIAFAFPVER